MKHILALLPLLLALDAKAAEGISGADTAWVLTSAVLVLLMTVPGIALFYGGMVRKKNVLGTVLQSFAVASIVSVLWYAYGYTLAFSDGNGLIGNFDHVLLRGISLSDTHGSIPEFAFVFFQMTFAVIATSLIFGSVAGRMRFGACCAFIALWMTLCYVPVCHWVWSDKGWLAFDGALDFAGGTVVHINAGVAGLIGALVLGKRLGYGREAMAPHNLVLSVIGASLLWVGWMGFNGGSALAANALAALACLTTQIATGAAACAWLACEAVLHRRCTTLGAVSGAVAGLVAITPAAGFVEPGAAVVIGLISGAVCFWSATRLKHMLGYDDSLDAFGVHGVGGFVGAILTGVFVSSAVTGESGNSMPVQVWIQFYASVVTMAYSAGLSFILYKLIGMVCPLRLEPDDERQGLDVSQHGEHIE